MDSLCFALFLFYSKFAGLFPTDKISVEQTKTKTKNKLKTLKTSIVHITGSIMTSCYWDRAPMVLYL